MIETVRARAVPFAALPEAGAITVVYVGVVECLAPQGSSIRRDYASVARECVTMIGGVLLTVYLFVALIRPEKF